jgi:hypothetical protein
MNGGRILHLEEFPLSNPSHSEHRDSNNSNVADSGTGDPELALTPTAWLSILPAQQCGFPCGSAAVQAEGEEMTPRLQ